MTRRLHWCEAHQWRAALINVGPDDNPDLVLECCYHDLGPDGPPEEDDR